jgi:hypothetical protein
MPRRSESPCEALANEWLILYEHHDTPLTGDHSDTISCRRRGRGRVHGIVSFASDETRRDETRRDETRRDETTVLDLLLSSTFSPAHLLPTSAPAPRSN